MSITLKQMKYVVALAETAHFGKAATRCNVTQSALSQQLKLTEQICGARLFLRSESGARPTPFGREFIARAQEILNDAERLENFALNHGGHPNRPITFGLIPTVAPYLVAEIYPMLRAALPDISINVSESRTEQLLAQLAEGTLDVGLIATPLPKTPHLINRVIIEDPFVVVAPARNTFKGPIQLNALSKNEVLLLDEGHCLRDQAMDACALSAGEVRRAFAATSLSTIVEFVANGQGVTLLPSISLKKEAADPRVQIVALASPGASRTLSLVWHPGSPFAQLFDVFAQTIREGAHNLSAWNLKPPITHKAQPAVQ